MYCGYMRIRIDRCTNYLLLTMISVFLVVLSYCHLGDQFPLGIAKIPRSNRLLSVYKPCAIGHRLPPSTEHVEAPTKDGLLLFPKVV